MSIGGFILAHTLTFWAALEECRSRALPEEEGFESLNNIDLNDTAVHGVSLNGLDSSNLEAVDAARLLTTAIQEDSISPPSGRVEVPDGFQASTPQTMNSRAPSLSILLPNPSRLPSPEMDPPIQLSRPSLNVSAHGSPLAESQPTSSSDHHDESPQRA